MSFLTPTSWLALAVALALGLAGCSRDNPQKHIASAKAFIEKQESKAAVIELKNALQLAPESAEARFLLGRALLEGGDPVAAAVELRKARDFKYPDEAVVPLLARALNIAGESRQLVEQFGSTTLALPKADADLKAALSVAQGALGNADAAQRALAAALKADPNNANARLIEARRTADRGEFDAALQAAEAILAKAPQEASAWVFKGDVLRVGKADADGALAAYRKALDVQPSHAGAHAALIAMLLQRKETDAAAAQTAKLKKYWPSALETKWFEAQVAYQRSDYKLAAKLAEQLLAVSPNNVSFLKFSAVIGLINGQALQAQNALSRAMQMAPGDPSLRRMLARAELRLGQPAKAMAALQPMLDKGPPDGEAYAVAAQALFLAGEGDKAQEYFAKAAQLNPADTVSRTALAVTRLGKDADGGLSDLREIAAADSGTMADLQIINALAMRRNFDGALAAIDQFEKKAPKNPLGPQLRGRVQMAKDDKAGARASFERALALDPTYFVASANLAALDLIEKKPEQAQKRFEKLLAADPKNAAAALALADVRVQAGAAPAEVTELLNNAIRIDPAAALPRMKLVEYLFKAKDPKAAVMAAQAGVDAAPGNAQLLEALARAHLVSNNSAQALIAYGKLATLQPKSATPQLRLAEIYMFTKSTDLARQSLKKALVIDPTSLPARRAAVGLELSAGNSKAALEQAQQLQKLRPKESPGFMFEGDVQAHDKNWPAAIAAYRQAFALDRSGAAAVGLHAALLGAGKAADAAAFAAARGKEVPADAVFISYLGDVALGRADYAAAEARFAEVVKLEPNSAAALNNLAWLLAEQQKKGSLAAAEKANALQPNQPPFVDTLAKALAFEGQAEKAVEVQKKLVDTLPDNGEYRLHLAKLYVQVGNRSQAKVELERLAGLGDKFADQREVGRMLKAL